MTGFLSTGGSSRPSRPPSAAGRTVLRGAAVTPAGLLRNARIEVAAGRIVSVGPADDSRPGGEELDLDDGIACPGLVDLHLHGAGGHDVMDGPAAIRGVARFIARRGVTAFLPTAVSAPIDRLAGFVADVSAAIAAQAAEREREGWLPEAAILGANLEGPALAPNHRGAHDPAALVAPSVLLDAWQTSPERWSAVRVVTLAPELPGGLELVRRLAADGRVASVGHTGATFEQAWAAFEAGARSTTHLFNQMTPLHHRAPGTVTAALTHPGASVELIADGLHVLPPVWPVVWRTAGDRLLLVSDAIAAAGGGDGELRLGGLSVTVRSGRATLPDGTLAGSTILLDGALANVVRAGLDPHAASRAASGRPAELARAAAKGRLEADADADLVVVGPDGVIRWVMLGGRRLEEAGDA